ncbi:hypothetical protein BFP70_12015 [Thioclava sp. SK-1]|uniref:hypothetical protein n=1 Tax=Thioclava sp. SK-1 TaxID=1889770 RepID=UPI00082718B7|nr:hypothetical protein [Thioclava sp. SK-1]OCX63725.1 hypothetical protein BFP70_12015 [Thioclava sp. SK-1]
MAIDQISEVVALFQQADNMIVDYLGMMENMRQHLRARIDHDTPLPPGAIEALHHGVENDIPWLSRALIDLEDDKRVVAGHLTQMRKALATATQPSDVESAHILLGNWANNADRSMESVINQNYQQSDIMPPPPNYWAPISHRSSDLFRYQSGSPQDEALLNAVLIYLRNVQNPWARYASP